MSEPLTVREFDERHSEINSRLDALTDQAKESDSAVTLRDYVEALFTDLLRATEIAERERATAAATLRDEQRRAMATADAEREKSASQLREAMARSIADGDERLREHVATQVEQIRAALLSAEKLEVERVDRVATEVRNLDERTAGLLEARIKAFDVMWNAQKEALAASRADMLERLAAVQRELVQATTAQKEAVIKAETATEKRFEGVNEWRAQSADRERSSAEERAKLQAAFMLKEVADNQFDQVRKTADARYEVTREQMATLNSRLDTMGGSDQGQEAEQHRSYAFRQQVIGILGVIVAVLTVLVIIAVNTHGFTQ